jgi:hypothetical protein
MRTLTTPRTRGSCSLGRVSPVVSASFASRVAPPSAASQYRSSGRRSRPNLACRKAGSLPRASQLSACLSTSLFAWRHLFSRTSAGTFSSSCARMTFRTVSRSKASPSVSGCSSAASGIGWLCQASASRMSLRKSVGKSRPRRHPQRTVGKRDAVSALVGWPAYPRRSAMCWSAAAVSLRRPYRHRPIRSPSPQRSSQRRRQQPPLSDRLPGGHSARWWSAACGRASYQ